MPRQPWKEKLLKKHYGAEQKAARKALQEFVDQAKKAGLRDGLITVRASDLPMRAKK